jgi:hypothetical protein
MKIRTLALISGIGLAATSHPAKAAQTDPYIDGRNMFATCASGDTDNCTSYVNGVVDGLQYAGLIRASPGDGVKVCLPLSVGNEKVMEIVKTYLNKHPYNFQYLGVFQVLAALEDAYPCH